MGVREILLELLPRGVRGEGEGECIGELYPIRIWLTGVKRRGMGRPTGTNCGAMGNNISPKGVVFPEWMGGGEGVMGGWWMCECVM